MALICACALAHFCACSVSPQASAGNSPAVDSNRQPVAGSVLTGNFKEGVSRTFHVDLKAGQYLRLSIAPQSASVTMKFFAPSGGGVAEYYHRQGVFTPASIIAEEAGTYRLALTSTTGEAPDDRASFSLRVSGVGKAGARDRSRLNAEGAFAEAERLRLRWSADSLREALKKYDEAQRIWHALGLSPESVSALNRLGEAHSILSEYQDALSFHDQALRLSLATGDRRGELDSLSGIGSVHLRSANYREALRYGQLTLRRARGYADPVMKARALYLIGTAQYFLSELDPALEDLNRALALFRVEGDVNGQAQSLIYISYVHTDKGEMDAASESLNAALSLWQRAHDRQGEAYTLDATGVLRTFSGDYQQGLDYHHQSLDIFRTIGDRNGEAIALTGLGFTYFSLGDTGKALHNYDRAADIYRELSNEGYEAVILANIGDVYSLNGDYQKALENYIESIPLIKAAHDTQTEAFTLSSIGTAYYNLGRYAQALDYYQRALLLLRRVKNRHWEANTLIGIGSIHEKEGRTPRALGYYQQALGLSRVVADRWGEALALYHIAHGRSRGGDYQEARARVEEALQIVETLRSKVASHDLRASYLATAHQCYELYIDVLMHLHKQNPAGGFEVVALQTSERSLARSLVETLAETRANTDHGVEPALLERERTLQQLLNASAERQMQILKEKHSEEEAEAIAKEVNDLTNEYAEVKARVRRTSTRYAALTQPQPLSLREIQQQVLDDETLLLEYALGEERSYLWAVTKDSITVHELRGRAEIEAAARRVYELLKAHQPVPGETLAARRARTGEADAQYWQASADLSRMILEPVAGLLGNKRLLIVADGALQYIPFGALTISGESPERSVAASDNDDTGEPAPLMIKHEIVSLPSASTLSVLRREMAGRTPAPKAVAVLADPVFEKDDPRIPSSFRAQSSAAGAEQEARPTGQAEKEEMVALHRAVRDAGVTRDDGVEGIPRLLASREEAEAIMRVAPAGAGLNAVGFDASRAIATSPELGKYRIVHFATHGLLNSEHPELSGVILSLLNQEGQPVNGFLRLYDIYNLNLPADLVVLSACNTGLGKDVRGEGLIGLTRGFMHAGASGVMASLWKVDDEATAELMKQFYRGVLKDGLPPAAALRQAQVIMWQQKPWRSPYYWAAFVLQGEYRERINVRDQPRPRAGRTVAAGAVVVVLVFSIGGLYARQKRRRRSAV